MPGTRNGTGIARNALVALAILLVAGVAGSFYLGVRARDAAERQIVDQARDIADQSLGLVVRPDDLAGPVSASRAASLTGRVNAVVVDPSNFDTVTLWSQDGQILYSTQGRIGNTLDGERERIRETLRGHAQTSIAGGTFSVMLPFQLRSNVGQPAAVELTTSSAPIDAAPKPWRTNALTLAVILAVVGFLLYRSTRASTVSALHPQPLRAAINHPGAQAAVPAGPSRPINVPTPGLREEGEARRRAEDRARAAEERLGVLQTQYRATLEELQTAQRRVQEQAAAARPDAAMQERFDRAERRARDFELQARELDAALRTLTAEHQELARLTPDPEALSKAREAVSHLTMERDGLRRERDALLAERDELAEQRAELASQMGRGIESHEDLEQALRLQQVETESIGLRAELDGAQTQIAMARRELEAVRAQAERAKELQEDLDAAHVEALHRREALEAAQSDLTSARAELEDARTELRALRNEEQRAAMLQDELRAARAELESVGASHRAELVEREADLEDKVRTAREEFQAQIDEVVREQGQRDAVREREMQRLVAEAQAAAAGEVARLHDELRERDARYGGAEDAVAQARAEANRFEAELAATRLELDATVEQLLAETTSVRELSDRVALAEREASEATRSAAGLAAELDAATQGNADLNRRLQEVEARRRLEVAEIEGRADLDDLLRVTQERLAGQTEKLIAAEDRSHGLERELTAMRERVEQVEDELRQQQMAAAMRELRGEPQEAPEPVAEDTVAVGEAQPFEDRRASTPFMKELSLDAKKSLTQILGLTQILKFKKDAKDQAQLVRQLTAYARRLDHVVADMADADNLVRGTVELTFKRTDLEALVQRVVEESAVGADHEVRLLTERVTVGIDQQRTEQLLAGLLRNAAERTPAKKIITVRLASHRGGAVVSVEDPESSTDGSISPVVRRFAEIQGGWAKVEASEGGGSAFRVFLPDGGNAPTGDDDAETAMAISPEASGDLHIVVEGQQAPHDEDWAPNEEQMLVQELHRLSELTAEE